MVVHKKLYIFEHIRWHESKMCEYRTPSDVSRSEQPGVPRSATVSNELEGRWVEVKGGNGIQFNGYSVSSMVECLLYRN